ncbi:MAG: PAP/fibrillin family protein [Cyanobacteria bacterium P01_E01_bin.42]
MAEIQVDPDKIFSELVDRGQCDRAALMDAIRVLEKKGLKVEEVTKLDGEWQLLWTSGTKQYQKLQGMGKTGQIDKSQQKIVQRINSEANIIENEVNSAIASLNVIGSFAYINNKIEFVFRRVIVKLGQLPAIAIPMGNWAKGWLKTTYLDENWHIERGDRGGISLYGKIKSEQE